MVDGHRLIDKLAWALAATSLSVVGCSASSDGATGGQLEPSAPITSNTPAIGASGSGAPTQVTQPPTTMLGGAGHAVTPPVNNNPPATMVTGSSGAPSVAMTGSSGAPAMMAGAAGAASGSTDTWTPQSNLDANGLLIKPVDGQGYQMQTQAFDLAPSQEVFACFHAQVPTDTAFPVGEWDGQMTKGSHHFILYRADGDTTPSGTLVMSGCTMGFGGSTWLYTQGTPRSHLLMPDGVAMVVQPHEPLVFDMHYLNTTTETLHVSITLNLNRVKTEQYQTAGSQVSFNVGIFLQPHMDGQVVQGNCPPVVGANYFIMQTHTHRFATDAIVTRRLASGQPGEELVHTTNWDMPQAHEWHSAPFLTFQQGESFDYKCIYNNDTDNLVTVGTSAQTNEMCMAEAYYFPATGNPPGCT